MPTDTVQGSHHSERPVPRTPAAVVSTTPTAAPPSAATAIAEAPADDEGTRPEAACEQPGPAEQVVLLDQIEALLDGLPPQYGELLRLRLEGDSVTDIARDMGLSRQSVHRMLNVLQERFADLDPDHAAR